MSENPDAPSEAAVTSAQRRRKRLRVRWLLGLTLVFLAAGLGYGVWWYVTARFYISTEDAYVHGNRIALMPRVQGTVTRIRVENTDYVERGQPMVELDDSDADVALEQAKANLAQTLREVRRLYVQAEEQKAIIDQRKASVVQARRDFDRARELYEKHSISQERFQQTETQQRNARAGLRAARHKLDALRAQTQGTDAAHHPQVLAARQKLRRAWLDLQRTTVVAPASGYIAQRSVQLGQQVTPGKPMAAIVPLNQIWVEANFKETDLSNVRIGQPVTIHADFYGNDVTYDGTVQGLSAGTGSAFELLPPQNATGNWIKVVQRVPVRVGLDAGQITEHPLRIGLSLTATIDVHDTNGLSLAASPSTGDRYATPVYRHDRAPLDAMIQDIVERNLGERAPGAANGEPGHGQ